jgi:hypothetical protein
MFSFRHLHVVRCPLPQGQVVWPQKLVWDSKKRQLYSFGVSFVGQNLVYWIEKIDMTGSCQQVMNELNGNISHSLLFKSPTHCWWESLNIPLSYPQFLLFACIRNQIPLQLKYSGIITAYTYDEVTSTIYYSIATNSGIFVSLLLFFVFLFYWLWFTLF